MEVLLAACCIGATGGTLLWRDDYFDAAADVVADGDIAYVALTTSGVLVVDMSNPMSPSILGQCQMQVVMAVTSIRYANSHVYVVNNKALFIISVKDPSSPVVVGSYTAVQDPVYEGALSPFFDVDGTMIYLAHPGYTTSVYLVDVSDPASPRLASTFITPFTIYGIAASSSYLYLSTRDNLQIYDVLNEVRRVGVIDGKPYSILVSGQTAYVGRGNGMQVYDIANLASPTLLGKVSGFTSSTLSLVGYTIYTAGGSDRGTCAVNVSDPTSPSLLGNITNDTCGGVASIGSSVLLACGKGMLQVFDVADPGVPKFVAQAGRYGEAVGIHGAGSLVAVADPAHNTVRVFNVSDPAEPALLSTVTPRAGVVARPFVLDTQVFVGTTEGLEAYDVTVPEAPQFMWGASTIGNTRALWVEGQRAYVGGSRGVFRVFDVSGAAPQVVGDLHSVGSVVDVTVVGDIAYLGSNSQGLLLVNTSTQRPTSCTGTSDVRGVSVSGSWAYLAVSSSGGPTVVDVSDPRRLVAEKSGGLNMSGTRGIDVVGTAAYAVDDTVGLHIIDAADPTDLVLFGTVRTDGGARGLYAVGTTVYVAARGLRVIEAAEIPLTPQNSVSPSDGTLVWVWVLVAAVILAACVALCLLAKKKLSTSGVNNDLVELDGENQVQSGSPDLGQYTSIDCPC